MLRSGIPGKPFDSGWIFYHAVEALDRNRGTSCGISIAAAGILRSSACGWARRLVGDSALRRCVLGVHSCGISGVYTNV